MNAPTRTVSPSHSTGMIDARQAATFMHLPYYWFADQHMRRRYRIPHYLLGGLVRYRLDELIAWAQRHRGVPNGSSPVSCAHEETAS